MSETPTAYVQSRRRATKEAGGSLRLGLQGCPALGVGSTSRALHPSFRLGSGSCLGDQATRPSPLIADVATATRATGSPATTCVVFDMEPLPSYEDINNAPTPDDVHTTAVAVIGASGARIPLAHGTRAQYDRTVISRLRSYGALTRTNMSYPADSPLRTQTFHPDKFYQAAISQLDVILPALSQPTLPATTALRTITLRIRLPAPDIDWVNEIKQTGLVQGRAVIKRALRVWFQRVNGDKGEEAVFEAVDSIAGRIAIEGFLILEEWWDLRRGLCMYTIRC
ncbi:hypothetical protein FRC10_003225 [Ceratobasidium sp. 414]|nr:hypothetical protein FRC10_003225 [Ceratobasidium sp. 414]